MTSYKKVKVKSKISVSLRQNISYKKVKVKIKMKLLSKFYAMSFVYNLTKMVCLQITNLSYS